jgi:CheY-like chemotaxis protein
MIKRDKPLIQVVDDQTTVVRILANLLQPEYTVCVATNGQMALTVAREQLPDLILLDMMMPDMTGIEVCERLKSDPQTRKIPVIFVTSMDDKHNEESGLRAGAVDYINKPPSPMVVMTRVKIHLTYARQIKFMEELASGELSHLEDIRARARSLLQ